jgi:hypothetical protein
MKIVSWMVGISVFAVIANIAWGCNMHRGDLGETSNKDGTCNSPSLYCSDMFDRCTAVDRPLSPVNHNCAYESECFCVACAEKCGEAGVKTCAYSDTSVWGAKPALCECK